MSLQEHINTKFHHVTCKVITVSDTRNKESDKSGKLMLELLQADGHHISDYVIVKDEKEQIRKEVLLGYDNEATQAILINGGTGIAERDVTIEAVKGLMDKEIDGFGELFRMLSYTEDIGSRAIMSRAIAGTINRKVIFSTPGSTGAVRLAMNKLILPELSHIISELHK